MLLPHLDQQGERRPRADALRRPQGPLRRKRQSSPSSADKRNRTLIDKWTFSTNGVAIQGRYGIPCVGFGPGAESQAHAPNEVTYKDDLVRCAAVYVAALNLYDGEKRTEDVTQFRAGLTKGERQQ